MSLRKIKFGDKEVYKKKFYSSLDSVDLNKIVVSKNGKLMIQHINIYAGI